MSSSKSSEESVEITAGVAPTLEVPQVRVIGNFFMCEVCEQLKKIHEETQEQHLASRAHINAELRWIQNALEGPQKAPLKGKKVRNLQDIETDGNSKKPDSSAKKLDQGLGSHKKSAYEQQLSKKDSEKPRKDIDQEDRDVIRANPDLDNSLISVMNDFGLSAEDVRLRRKVFDHIKMFLAHILRGSDGHLKLVGSSYTRAGLKDSGIDICFEDCSPECMMSALKWVKGSGNFVDVKDNLHSSPPRFSFTDKKSGIQCTISCETEQSVRSSEYVEELLAIDQRALILAQCFRYWARVCQIDKTDEGCMKGYCFTLMLISYLQTQLVLPPIGGKKVSSWKSNNTKTIGELWLGLLRFYKRHFFKEDIYISITADMSSDKIRKSHLIVVEDPCARWNVAHPPVKRKVFSFMKECFKKSLQYFSSKQSSNEVSTPSDARKSRSSSRKKEKSESDMEVESGSEVEGSESEDNDSDEEDIVDDIDDHHDIDDGIDYALLDLDTSSSEENGQELSTKDDSSDDERTRKRSRAKSGSLEDGVRFESGDGENRQIHRSDATGNGPDVRPRRTSSNPDSQVFRFTKKKLCGKMKRPLLCIDCKRNNHVVKDCPDKKIDLQELPQLTDVHYQLLETLCVTILRSCEPPIEEVQGRQNALRRLERYIKVFFHDAKLYLFGSSNNGFGFRNSDMDICMMLGQLRSDQIEPLYYITELNRQLKKCDFVWKVHAIKTAKVPIVKFVFSHPEIEADISLYNNLALENTELLLSYGRIDGRVRLLGYALKYFAKACEIGDASRGTISSYAYILMLIHYLQNRKPPVLPVLQQLYLPNEKRRTVMVDGWDVNFFKNINELPKVWDDYGKNQESVGELWLGFFRYYVEEFDFERDVITIRQRDRLTKFEKGWNRYTMAIEDPFKRDHNLGAGINEKVFYYIFKIFANARNLYGMPVSKVNNDVVGYFYDIPYLKRNLDMPQDRLCNICGKIGHAKRNCPERQDKSVQLRQCKFCKEVGHMMKHCPEKRKGKKGRDDQTCLKCGKVGHFKKDCPDNDSQKLSDEMQNAKVREASATKANHEEEQSNKMQSVNKAKSSVKINEESKMEGQGGQKKKPQSGKKPNSTSNENTDETVDQLVSFIDQLKLIVNNPNVAIRIGELNEDLAALQSKITPAAQSKKGQEKKANKPKKRKAHSKERMENVASMADLGEGSNVNEAVAVSAFVSPRVQEGKSTKPKRGQTRSKEGQRENVLIDFEEAYETGQSGSVQLGQNKQRQEKNAAAKRGTANKGKHQISDISLIDLEDSKRKEETTKMNFNKKQRNKTGNGATAKREQSSETSNSDSESPYESHDENSLMNVHGGAIKRTPAKEQDKQNDGGKAGKRNRRTRRVRQRDKEKNRKSAEQDLDVETVEENAENPGRRRTSSATTLSRDDSAVESKRVVKTNLGASKENREFLSLFTLGPSINFAKATDFDKKDGNRRPNRAASESLSETDDSVHSGSGFRGSRQRGRGGHRGRGDNRGRGDKRGRGDHRGGGDHSGRGDPRGRGSRSRSDSRGSNRGRADQSRGTPHRGGQSGANERERSYSTSDSFLEDYGFQFFDDGPAQGGGRGQRGHRSRGRGRGRMRGRGRGGGGGGDRS